MADETPDRDPEIRRRAAWLLGMLALVAALFVTLMVTFFNSSGGEPDNDLADPTGIASTSATPGTPTPTSPDGGQAADPTSPGSSDGSTGASTPPASSSSTTSSTTSSTSSSPSAGGRASCPSDEPCALTTDIGDAITAINAYRKENGKSVVPGSVSEAAAKCALSNGSDCSGGWAQTQVPADKGKADGEAAVDKIKQLGKLLTDMKSIEVGWAYDPGAKTFYFAIVRQD